MSQVVLLRLLGPVPIRSWVQVQVAPLDCQCITQCKGTKISLISVSCALGQLACLFQYNLGFHPKVLIHVWSNS